MVTTYTDVTGNTASSYIGSSYSAIPHLDQGETVDLGWCTGLETFSTGWYTSFSGFLI